MAKRKARSDSSRSHGRPEVFVASSVGGLEAAYAIQQLLESSNLDVTVWSQGVFGSSDYALANLSEIANRTDFAVFVFTYEDAKQLRNSRVHTVRDNIILELGIFLGLLGATRTFVIAPHADKALRLPSDLSGFAFLSFNAHRTNLDVALSPAVQKIVAVAAELGPRPRAHTAESTIVENERLPIVGSAASFLSDGSKRKKSHVFISYSHKDRVWLERLQTMLKPLVRIGDVVLWDDTMIDAGREWRIEIRSAISSAKVALLLVSPDFLASEFIANNELPPILNSASKGQLVVLWAALSKAFWDKTEISKYQAAHDVSKPLDSLRTPAKRNQILYDICVKIAKALEG